MSVEEKTVVEHFKNSHSRTSDGRFVVPIPKKENPPAISESRSKAVRRFQSLERSLHFKGQFDELSTVMEEYFEKNHAERVPMCHMEKAVNEVYYLPIQVVRKESSSTTKLRAVFDASAPSSTGTSLNDTLLVGQCIRHCLMFYFDFEPIGSLLWLTFLECTVLYYWTTLTKTYTGSCGDHLRQNLFVTTG